MLSYVIDEVSWGISEKELDNDFKEFQTNYITAIGNDMVENARNTTKFNHGEKFNQGIQFTLLSDSQGEVTSQVYNNGVEYSNFLEYGNLPVDNKLMTFKINGRWISTYKRKAISNEHLGFFSDAQEKTNDNSDNIFEEEWNKIFK
jgi:hypothetical protein